MENNSNIEIANPRLWVLALRIDSAGMAYTIHSTVENNSLIYRDVRFDLSASSYKEALEQAVYDHKHLLDDFSEITVVIESESFVIVPNSFTQAHENEAYFNYIFPEFEGDIEENSMPRCNSSVLFGIENGVLPFIRRTFNNPRILHHLTPLCEYFYKKSRLGNNSKMYVHFREHSIDIMAYNKTGLLTANTTEYRSTNDAMYYILNMWEHNGLDQETDELQMSGNRDIRAEITPMLREYLAFVMPTMFPSSMFKLGKDSMIAPFDLIVLPLCE